MTNLLKELLPSDLGLDLWTSQGIVNCEVAKSWVFVALSLVCTRTKTTHPGRSLTQWPRTFRRSYGFRYCSTARANEFRLADLYGARQWLRWSKEMEDERDGA